jgi:class 3 adenylate cyclase
VAPSQPSRHLTTVLFLDIVGSTRVASDLGDARWHTLLASFRREVGHHLHAHHGREQNFTGDGILATFPAPEQAVECAVRIARGVQDLGLDVRAGVHTGQVETIQGQLGGVAVHIGARVMALAGDAEVLVTSTTRDLLRGSGVVFGEPTTHELKGVSGSWEVVPVRSVGTLTAPEPIDPQVAVERLDQIEAVARRRRKRTVLGAVAAFVVVLLIAGWFVVRDGSTEASPGSVSLVRLDPGGDHAIVGTVDDGMLSDHLWGALSIQNGTLYQRTPTELRIRDVTTGAVERPPIPVDESHASVIGFGSEWVGRDQDQGSIERVDLVSGEVVATLDITGGAPVIAVGPDAVWFTTRDGQLGRIDPVTLEVRQWPSGAIKPGAVVPFADHVWICDCDHGQIFRFDIASERFTRFDLPEKAYLIGPSDGTSPAQLWLVDQEASTITPLNPATGATLRPHGFNGVLADAEIGLGKIWIASADHVYVLDATGDSTDVVTVDMPPGFFASSVAIDTQNETVWIGTCGCPLD